MKFQTHDLMGYLIAAHLCGDFILQNEWMQAKRRSHFVCAVHVACYSIPFFLLMWLGLFPMWALLLILIEHYLQDRYALYLAWMEAFGQSSSDKWAVGPLCIDQSFHIVSLAVVAMLTYFFNPL